MAGDIAPPVTGRQPFRLFDLPPELQLLIYQRYFEDAHATVVTIRDGVLRFKGMPSLNLERACRQILVDSRNVRDRICSPTLTVAEGCGFDETIDLLSQNRQYTWICSRIKGLIVQGLAMKTNQDSELETIPDKWPALLACCPLLEAIEIQFRSFLWYVSIDVENLHNANTNQGEAGVQHWIHSRVSQDLDVHLRRHELANALCLSSLDKEFKSRGLSFNWGLRASWNHKVYLDHGCMTYAMTHARIRGKKSDTVKPKRILWTTLFDIE